MYVITIVQTGFLVQWIKINIHTKGKSYSTSSFRRKHETFFLLVDTNGIILGKAEYYDTT